MLEKICNWLCSGTLRLQEGRYYRSKDNVIYGPLKEIGTMRTGYCFKDDKTGFTWTYHGKYRQHSECPTDLVEEVCKWIQ